MGQDISACEATDVEIVEGLKSNDGTFKNWAAEQLLQKYAGRIRAFIRRKGATDFDADDILMEAIEQSIEKIDTYDPDRGASLFTWLCQIAENRRIDHYRKSHAQKRPQITKSTDENVADYSFSKEDSNFHGECPRSDYVELEDESLTKSRTPKERALHSALAKLHPNYQKILTLRYFIFNSPGEVAASLDKSEEAVNMQLSRASKRLRELLIQYPEFNDYFNQ